jgi:hypothetical protein
MKEVFLVIALTVCIAFGFAGGYDMGRQKGYARGVADTKAAVLPAPRVTDQQCVAWLFETNLKEARKRICK